MQPNVRRRKYRAGFSIGESSTPTVNKIISGSDKNERSSCSEVKTLNSEVTSFSLVRWWGRYGQKADEISPRASNIGVPVFVSEPLRLVEYAQFSGRLSGANPLILVG